jgi:hypothetical protein
MFCIVNEMPKLLVAGLACLLTFFVARKVIRGQLRVGPPNLVAALVAGLAFVGLCGSGGSLLGALSIPYAALALALMVWFLWLGFTQSARRFGTYKQKPGPKSEKAVGGNATLIKGKPWDSIGHDRPSGEPFGSRKSTLPTPEQHNPRRTKTKWWS